MNRPDDKQIERVLTGLATSEEAREVAKWFATDEGSEFLSKNFDEDINSLPLDNADLLIDHINKRNFRCFWHMASSFPSDCITIFYSISHTIC